MVIGLVVYPLVVRENIDPFKLIKTIDVMIYLNYKVEFNLNTEVSLEKLLKKNDAFFIGKHEYEKVYKGENVFFQFKKTFYRSSMPDPHFSLKTLENGKKLSMYIQVGDSHIIFIFLLFLFFVLSSVVSFVIKSYMGILSFFFVLLALYFLDLSFTSDKYMIESDLKKEFGAEKFSEEGGFCLML